jgi:hypothetical protein
MTRLFCVGMMVAALLFAVPAVASVPDPGNCSHAWVNPITTGVIGICPSADYSGIQVTVMDQFSQPIVGAAVSVTFADTTVHLQNPAAGTTIAGGIVTIMFDGGLNVMATKTCVSSNYTVIAGGVTIGSGTVKILSPDYNTIGLSYGVDQTDFTYFGLDWNYAGTDIRSDFFWTGLVDPSDFSKFALHWNH